MGKRCLLLVLFLAVSLVGWSANPTGNSLQLFRGRAAISRNGGTNWLELGPEPIGVKVGYMVRTEGDSRAEIRMADGSIYRAKGDSVFTLMDWGITMQVGDLWLILPTRQSTFQVVSPTAICGVLGTNFDVRVDRFGQTQVRVFSGIVSTKAREDKRNRQLVLQRGMMAAISDKTKTPEKYQKLDPDLIETQVRGEWERSAYSKVRTGSIIGPGLPGKVGLPPIRAPMSEEPVRQNVEEEERTSKTGIPEGEPGDIRDQMNFFQSLHEQRLRERIVRERMTPQGGLAPWEKTSVPIPGEVSRKGFPDDHQFPTDFSPFREQPLPREMDRQGHGRMFGQNAPIPTGIQNERQLQSEILSTRSRIVMVQNRIAQLTTEIEAYAAKLTQISHARLRNPSPADSTRVGTIRTEVGAGLTADQIRNQIGTLKFQLADLREQQQKLVYRLNDLRNRLY